MRSIVKPAWILALLLVAWPCLGQDEFGDRRLLNLELSTAAHNDPSSPFYLPQQTADMFQTQKTSSHLLPPAVTGEAGQVPGKNTVRIGGSIENRLKAAREKLVKARGFYTRLVTTGPYQGDVNQALRDYKAAIAEVEQLENEPVRVGGDIKPPKLIKHVDPEYPEIAQTARIQGVVILEATTDSAGEVVAVEIIRSIPLLDEAAVTAVKQWIYEPYLIDGVPRGVIFTVTVNFSLK